MPHDLVGCVMANHVHGCDHEYAEIIDRYADIYNEHVNEGQELDALEEVLHPEFHIHELAGIDEMYTFEEYKEFAGGFLGAFDDLTLPNVAIVVDGDMSAQRTIMKATHTGELLGVPASNEEVVMPWQWYTRWKDGKIVEKWDQPDVFRLFLQIGQFPDPDEISGAGFSSVIPFELKQARV